MRILPDDGDAFQEARLRVTCTMRRAVILAVFALPLERITSLD